MASLHAVFVLGRELGLVPGLAGLAATMTGLTSWLLWAALSGMEIQLFILLSLWGIILHIREKRSGASSAWALAVLALSALVRPEGFLLVVFAAVDRLLLWSRSDTGELRLGLGCWQAVLKGMLCGAILIAPIILLNWSFSGSLLPTTFGAKSGGLSRLLPDLHFLYEVISIFIRAHPYMLFLSLAGVLVLIERLGKPGDRGLLPGLWLVGLPLAYSMISPSSKYLLGNFGRYFYPLFPIMILLGTLGLARAARVIGPRVKVGKLSLPLRPAIVALLLWPTLSTSVMGAGLYIQSVGNIEDGDVKMAKWLAERVDPRAVLAVNDVGALKYFLPNRVVDLAGIIHPRVASYIREARESGQDWRNGVLRVLDETQPDFLVIFPGWYPGLEDLNSSYAPQFELAIPANIALGGNRIVVYSTPWTRYPLQPLGP